jgi:hypothetical protein
VIGQEGWRKALGSEATKGIEARRRKLAARIERLIEEAERTEPLGVARRHRIKDAVRRGLREQRGIEAHTRAMVAAEVRQGRVLIELTQEGMSERASYRALRLSRPVGERRLKLARTALSTSRGEFSTVPARRVGDTSEDADRETDGGVEPGAFEER